MSWTDICAVNDIIPGTGVCALRATSGGGLPPLC
jgi:hypothetical protein